MFVKYPYNRSVLFLFLLLVVLPAVLIAAYLVYMIRSVFPPFLLALAAAYLLNPLVEKLEEVNIPRVAAIIIVYVAVMGAATLVILYGMPKVIRELNHFAEAVPDYTAQVQEYIRNLHSDYSRSNIPESIRQVTDETIVEAEELLIAMVDAVVDRIIGLFSGVWSLIIAPVLTFYMLKDWEVLGRYIFNLFPTNWREEAAFLINETDLVLTKFIRGHLLVAALVGTATAAGLALLKVKFALLLGIVAGVADLIPYFGPIIGAVPALAIALLHSKYQALYVLGVMFLVQQLESNLISPKILGDSVGLHPLVIVFVLLAGGQLFGVLGMLLAVPVTAVGRIVFRYLFYRFHYRLGGDG